MLKDKFIMCEYKGMTKKELEEFADRMRVDRNSFLSEKERLETELYFCNRNNKIKEVMSIH